MAQSMRNVNAYLAWLKRKLRQRPVQVNAMQFGSIYTFAYDAPKGDREMGTDDITPMIIIYRFQNGGYLGLNLVGIRREIREKILKEYEIAKGQLEAGNNKPMLDLMLKLRRNNFSKLFMKFYKLRGFRSRPVEVTSDDIAELKKIAF